MYRIIGADGREYGPVASDQLRNWILEGRANAATRVRQEAGGEWKTLGSCPEFSLLFSAAAQPGSPAVLSGASARRTNGFAITGMILGIVSFFFCCFYGLPFNVLGIAFSIAAIVQIRDRTQNYEGMGMAVTGLVLSTINFFLYVGMGILGLWSTLF